MQVRGDGTNGLVLHFDPRVLGGTGLAGTREGPAERRRLVELEELHSPQTHPMVFSVTAAQDLGVTDQRYLARFYETGARAHDSDSDNSDYEGEPSKKGKETTVQLGTRRSQCRRRRVLGGYGGRAGKDDG